MWRRGAASAAGAVVGAGLVAAIVIRFVAGSPLWLDEALSVHIAGDGESLSTALRRDGHPPLYYAALRVWTDLFGTSAASARAMSGVVSLVTLPALWLLGRRLASARTASIAVVVMIISGFAIRYASEARMYALLVLLATLFALALERTHRMPGPTSTAAIALTSGALALTHYWSFFVLLAVGVVAVAGAFRASSDERSGHLSTIGGLAGGAVVFLPWIGVFLDQLDRTGTPWASASPPTAVLHRSLVAFGGGNESPDAALAGAVVLAVTVLALFSRRRTDDSRAEEATIGFTTVGWERYAVVVVGGSFAIGAAASYATDSAFQGRYAAIWLPPVVLLIAAGLERVPRQVAVVALIGLAFTSATSAARNLDGDRTQAGQWAAALDRDAEARDVVAVCPDQLGPASAAAFGDRYEILAYPLLDDGRTVDWRDYEERNAAADPAAAADEIVDRAAGRTVWVVWVDGYLTFDAQCSQLVAELAGRLGPVRPLVAAMPDEAAENGHLYGFG